MIPVYLKMEQLRQPGSVIADSAEAEYCSTFQDSARIKMQQGSIFSEDQDATRIKMQQGSRFSEVQDATTIKMQ